ncbi:potassium channel family protein [Methanospirillum stamsii]|uniref:Potassium transporter TrkA n=1 Tax=Methanospirillum stamsii TaxID=1277351 RepID=A0A2V2N3D0_9EURY|nr:NAD-binding protein [Methanospirillum stamsii]PWR69753.1 potassium transporter TrkA [Methanospirillum stamsii]
MKLIIIGCGRMGSGLALRLVRAHHDVTVVDHDSKAFERLGKGFTGHFIQRDALDQESFYGSEIDKADGLAAVTGNDAVNIVVARAARQLFRVPKVIARTHDPRYAELYHKLGIQTVTNVKLGIERISEILTFSHLDIIHGIGNGEVGIVRYEIHPTLAGHQVKDLTVPGEIIVISLTRKGKTSIPTLGTTFEKGDIVHIAVEEQSVDRLKEVMQITGGG